jgi:NADP-dependent 3-hydroxy acid dehydrogenase YdfG
MENKVSIIIGASSGIGEATAKELASVRIKLRPAARWGDRLVKLKQEI